MRKARAVKNMATVLTEVDFKGFVEVFLREKNPNVNRQQFNSYY